MAARSAARSAASFFIKKKKISTDQKVFTNEKKNSQMLRHVKAHLTISKTDFSRLKKKNVTSILKWSKGFYNSAIFEKWSKGLTAVIPTHKSFFKSKACCTLTWPGVLIFFLVTCSLSLSLSLSLFLFFFICLAVFFSFHGFPAFHPSRLPAFHHHFHSASLIFSCFRPCSSRIVSSSSTVLSSSMCSGLARKQGRSWSLSKKTLILVCVCVCVCVCVFVFFFFNYYFSLLLVVAQSGHEKKFVLGGFFRFFKKKNHSMWFRSLLTWMSYPGRRPLPWSAGYDAYFFFFAKYFFSMTKKKFDVGEVGEDLNEWKKTTSTIRLYFIHLTGTFPNSLSLSVCVSIQYTYKDVAMLESPLAVCCLRKFFF